MAPISLPDRFELDCEIGRGGMAVVYRAHDRHLGRFVAIKVLSPGVSESLGNQRFEREISLMAKLVHPGIVALFDSGVSDGCLFYVMPLVSGETLRARLGRERRLTPHDCAALGADIAEALACAHGMGIVHRDVKPENIFTVSGRAVLADFGIARLLGERPDATNLTTLGTVLGTAAYMSPEQAGGEPDLDGRSDLYSLGCVLYELLTGQPPFTAATYMAMIGKHMTEAPVSPSARGVTLSPALENAVLRLLAKEKTDRPADAADVARLLRAATHSLITVIPLPSLSPATGDVVSVTLLEAPAGDAESGALALDVSRAVAASLLPVPRLRVVAHDTTEAASREVAAATMAVQGNIRRSGNRVRISVRVVDANGALQWSQNIDGLLDDPFGLEDTVSARVAGHFTERALSTQQPTGTTARLPANRTTRKASDADQLVAEGKKVFARVAPTTGGNDTSQMHEAKAYFTRALALDPHHARALSALGNWYYVNGIADGIPNRELFDKGRDLVFAALAADDQCAEVHCSMGKLALFHDDDLHTAARHIRRAIELDPYEPEALRLMSIVYKILGRTDDAVNSAREATERAPDLAPLWNALADSLLGAGRNAEAIDALRRALDLLPGFGPALERLELAHERLGHFDLAIELRVARLRRAGLRERADVVERESGEAGGNEAIRRDIRRELAMLLTQAASSDPFLDYVRRNVGDRIVRAYAELGEWTSAMDWVERAFERRPGRLRRMLADLPVDYRGLAVDPRYARLLRVAGLENLI